jgi:acetyl esterase/lipase
MRPILAAALSVFLLLPAFADAPPPSRAPKSSAPRAAAAAMRPAELPVVQEMAARSPLVPGQVTLEQIMADPLDWLARPPVDFYFSDDGKAAYFTQARPRESATDLSRIDLASGRIEQIEDAALGSADQEFGAYSADRRFKVWEADGNVFWRNLQTGETRQLTRTLEAEVAPFFLIGGGRKVAFKRGDGTFVRDLDSGLEYLAADLRLSKDPAEAQSKEDYLSLQQPRLLEVVRERQEVKKAREERARARQAADPTLTPPPFYLGDDVTVLDQLLSPTGEAMLLALQPKGFEEGRADKMANWITEDGYVEVIDVREKVGTGNLASVQLVLLDLVRHERHDLDAKKLLAGFGDDPLAEIRARQKKAAAKPDAESAEGQDGEPTTKEKAAAEEAAKAEEQARAEREAKGRTEAVEGEGAEAGTKEAEAKAEAAKELAEAAGAGAAGAKKGEATKEEEPAKVERALFYLGGYWSPDGRQVAAVLRTTDNKDRWLAIAGLDEPRWRVAHRLTREGWVNWDYNEIDWLKSSDLLFLSEETGYSHLHLWDPKTGAGRVLTSGKMVVGDPVASPDGRWVYYTANPDHPGIYDVYRVAVADGKVERLTALQGQTEFRLSGDGTKLLLRHSKALVPPELYLQDAKPGAKATQLTQTSSKVFAGYPWVAPEVVAVPSRHGAEGPVYSRFYAPRNPDKLRGADGKVPAVMFIHGAGYLQNAHHGWSTYQREFLFHTYLAEQGYAVIDMDYRGSAGYGAGWREAIYRQMGTPELEDMEDGLAWLIEHHGVDPKRLGIYGGSYGGFLTLMGLFKTPDVYACGAALRPVTDWAHYNHGYTANILNTPKDDPEAYERSSPIEFAAGLSKPLLMCAPMQDDNVFFQDTVRLAQKLIELEKDDWEVAIYPVEPHGFRRASSWLDEYKRIAKLFAGCLAP